VGILPVAWNGACDATRAALIEGLAWDGRAKVKV